MGGFGLCGSAHAQSVSFNDTFTNGSTIDNASPAAPTSNSTNYTIASTKNATSSSINSNDLKLSLTATTTSGFEELQALFVTAGSTAYSLVNTGDTIEYDVTFKDTSGGLLLSSGSQVLMGLYNSGGTAPESGTVLVNAGLNSTAGSGLATGGTQLWQGYVGQFNGSGGTSKMFVRPPQNGSGTTSANQELLENGFGGGAFTNPTQATNLATGTSSIALTSNSVYTGDLLMTNLGGGSISLTETLYTGAGTAGTILEQVSVASTTAVDTTFDGLGFSVSTKTTANPIADISDISVVYTPASAPMPEPATLGLFGIAGLGLLRRRRPKT